MNQPGADNLELCHYLGTIRDQPGSWAALSTCQGSIQGVIFDGAEMHHVERIEEGVGGGEVGLGGGGVKKNSSIEAPHYIYSHKHLHENLNR